MVKASLKLMVCTHIFRYTVEGNVEYLIWIGTFRGVKSPHVQQQAPLSSVTTLTLNSKVENSYFVVYQTATIWASCVITINHLHKGRAIRISKHYSCMQMTSAPCTSNCDSDTEHGNYGFRDACVIQCTCALHMWHLISMETVLIDGINEHAPSTTARYLHITLH